MTKAKRWSRAAIEAFLAKGGDIKAVDKFLFRGGRIPAPVPKTVGTGYVSSFGDYYPLGKSYSSYLESPEENRLTRSCGGVLHDDYSEESFP